MSDRPEWAWDSLSEESKRSQYDGYESVKGVSRGLGRTPKEQYESSHYDEPNILAHVRLKDRKGPKYRKTGFPDYESCRRSASTADGQSVCRNLAICQAWAGRRSVTYPFQEEGAADVFG